MFDRIQDLRLPAPEGHQPLHQVEGTNQLSGTEIRRFLRFARDGQQVKAWKQLHSCGLAPVNETSFQAAMSKLKPRHAPPMQPPDAHATWHIPDDHWNKCTKQLKAKRAPEPGGWTAELWQHTWHQQPLHNELLTWIKAITSTGCDDVLLSFPPLATVMM